MSEKIKQAVYKTLAYADIFSYPLTKEEIWHYLIWDDQGKPPSKKEFEQTFSTLKIKAQDNYYFLSDKKNINDRRKKETDSAPKIIIAQQTVSLLRKIPFIKLIGLTGNLAMKNSEKNDDIDLFIICQHNTLWLTRFLAILALDLKGLRRKSGDRQFKDKMCLNMFMDEHFLEIPLQKQNLYSAHEVSQLRPVFSKNNIYQYFIAKNIWIKKFLPNVSPLSPEKRINMEKQPTLLILILSLLNFIFFIIEFLYMCPRLTKEVVTIHLAFFHPQDATNFILEKYREKTSHLP